MGRKTITVPNAGQTKQVKITGRSVIVEQANPYLNVGDVPLLSFDQPGQQRPALTRSVYGTFNGGIFDSIVVTGTAESAGDNLTLFSTYSCLDDFINFDALQTAKSVMGATQTKDASDSVQGFSDGEIADPDGNLPKRLYIYVVGGATRGINFAYENNPVQGDHDTSSMYWDNDRSHESAGDKVSAEPLEIVGLSAIQKFKFIATVAGEIPTLVWTPEF